MLGRAKRALLRSSCGKFGAEGGAMTDALFWDIVNALDWSKWDANDDDAVLEPAITKLAALPVREICMFDEFLHWRVYSLDTREHARHFAPGVRYRGYVDADTPFSTDGFLYCRGMVVAGGQQEYEAVLADPTRMARDGFERFLYLAMYADERKTGEDYEYEPGFSYEAFSNPAGWLRGVTEPAPPKPKKGRGRKKPGS
jgi:hypothetical protein